ncbi:hypothetical protein AB0O28_19130 [Microbispora sp. NPDC088329]|uniref:hypothetical protein n=1 Tax=Microbispora sp. NPDC088329 TaxID=3154869 RepID=UPI00341255F5
MTGYLELLAAVAVVFAAAVVLIVIVFHLWGRWDARRRRRRTAEIRARFNAIVAEDLHDVFADEDL